MEQDLFEVVQAYRAAASKAERILVNLQGGVDPDRVVGFNAELVEELTAVRLSLDAVMDALGAGEPEEPEEPEVP